MPSRVGDRPIWLIGFSYPGVDARIGTAAANSYGRGGGIQIELPRGLKEGWFGEPRPITPVK